MSDNSDQEWSTRIAEAEKHAVDAKAYAADAKTHATIATAQAAEAKSHSAEAKSQAAEAKTEAAGARSKAADARTEAADAKILAANAAVKAANAETEAADAVARVAATTPAAKELCDAFKEHYKESLNNFRYYGTLRSQIAWAPATIIFAAVGFFWDKIDWQRIEIFGYVLGPYIPGTIVTLILFLIFIANLYLQFLQRGWDWANTAAQAHWHDALSGRGGFVDNRQLVEQGKEILKQKRQAGRAKRGVLGWRVLDGASWCLLVFFVFLTALAWLLPLFDIKPRTTSGSLPIQPESQAGVRAATGRQAPAVRGTDRHVVYRAALTGWPPAATVWAPPTPPRSSPPPADRS